MSSTRQNGLVTITNDENYDLANHMARLADSANVVIRVPNQAARDALTLTQGLVVCRLDRGHVLEIYDGTTWQSNDALAYTPTLGATTTNPSIGAGNISAAFSVVGKNLMGQAIVNFGSGATAGSGAFYLTLPAGYTYAPVDPRIPIGWFTVGVGTSLISGYLRQGGASNSYVNMYWQPTATTQSAVSNSTFAWGSGSQICLSWSVFLA